jgi:hypothetical protein
MKEHWKDIVGFEGYYKISNKGCVLSVRNDTVLKPVKNRGGYVAVDLFVNGNRFNRRIHRLVADAFISNPFGLPVVDHKDGNRENNNETNLRWVTQAQNLKHSYERTQRNSGNAKLTNKQVLEIRAADKPISVLIDMFGVSRMTIRRVKDGITYRRAA